MNKPKTDNYHLRELEIARNPSDPRHCLPKVPALCSRVLDVGCGAGQTLLALHLPQTTEAWGVDVDGDAIVLGNQLAPHLRLLLATAERLPPEIQNVDFVYSRVALPLMQIHVAHAEMARVLSSDGTLWFALHPARMALREWQAALRRGRYRDVVARSYVVACGLWFWLTGRTFAAPWGARHTESWQSIRGMKLALARVGLELTSVERSPQFIVTARRIPNS